MARHRRNVSRRTGALTFVTVVVTAVWGSSFVLEIILPDFNAPDGLGDLMLLVAGAAFGARQMSASASEKE